MTPTGSALGSCTMNVITLHGLCGLVLVLVSRVRVDLYCRIGVPLVAGAMRVLLVWRQGLILPACRVASRESFPSPAGNPGPLKDGLPPREGRGGNERRITEVQWWR